VPPPGLDRSQRARDLAEVPVIGDVECRPRVAVAANRLALESVLTAEAPPERHEIEDELPDVRRLLAGRVAPRVAHAVLVAWPPDATPADEPALVAGNPDLVAIHAGRVDHRLGAAGVDDL